MELRKTTERWNRSFDQEGTETGNSLESVLFDVTDAEGNTLGSATVRQYDGNAHVNFPEGGSARVEVNGHSSIEQGIGMLKTVMGITE